MSKVYRTKANDFAVAANCTGELVWWVPDVQDTSEPGLGSQAHYEDVAKPRFHARMDYIAGDLFRCPDCGFEKRDVFLSIMRTTYLPAMVDLVFRSSSLFSYLKSSPSRLESQ